MKKDNLKLIQGDCMDVMKDYPDNYFDLAIVDPEYGIGASKPSIKPCTVKQKNGSILRVKQPNYIQKDWDDKPADSLYFKELKRVSKNQIIFGCNYYDFNLKGGRIVWDKLNGDTDQFDCEIAYNSLNNRTDIVYYLWSGMFQGTGASKNIKQALKQKGNKKDNEKRIHPTQKPVILYDWIYKNYATKDMKVLDTHLGSGSNAISAYYFGVSEFVGVELDEDYFKAACKRVDEQTNQLKLF